MTELPFGSKDLIEFRRNKLTSDEREGLNDERDIEIYRELAATSAIVPFYAGRQVLITGGTGFIGKALIEKLVRGCPSIGKIYILIREKRGKTASQRLKELLDSEIYGIIKNRADLGLHLLEEKLHAIGGDISEPNLGISQDDLSLLAENVSIVFNVAATVRFVEPLRDAWRLNVYSCTQLINVCDKLNKLDAIVHVSTAYSNCSRIDYFIDEQIYKPPLKSEQLDELLARLQECQECATAPTAPRGVLERKPLSEEGKVDQDFLMRSFAQESLHQSNQMNIYTFTKSIAEDQLLSEAKQRPDRYLGEGRAQIGIVRPSIVGGAFAEPSAGFVDTLDGPTAIPFSYYTGSMQMMPARNWRNCDAVPVDMVVNLLISSSFFLAQLKRDPTQSWSASCADCSIN